MKAVGAMAATDRTLTIDPLLPESFTLAAMTGANARIAVRGAK